MKLMETISVPCIIVAQAPINKQYVPQIIRPVFFRQSDGSNSRSILMSKGDNIERESRYVSAFLRYRHSTLPFHNGVEVLIKLHFLYISRVFSARFFLIDPNFIYIKKFCGKLSTLYHSRIDYTKFKIGQDFEMINRS